MSTISANDLQNTSGGIPTVKGQRLIPTAWVNFNGTGTITIRDSENVSSITDMGPGLYRVNFAITMPNANYAAMLSASKGSGYRHYADGYQTPSTSYMGVHTGTPQVDDALDVDHVFVAILGGQ